MEHPVVSVKDGFLRGAKVKSIEGVDYFSFLGIPYAEPPLNELRFQDTRPCKPWTGIRDALNESDEAVQIDLFFLLTQSVAKTTGGEDCLYLNVATPSLTGNKAVLVWIHGGGFCLGSSKKEMYSPDYFMKHDVVFVSMNYRLGIFGFLNMDQPDCAGNQGLKDQLAALKWVQDNISVFGGNPNNVTIFGQSAGGASVHALCLSPLSKGLFHKAILQSGSIYNPWAYKHENKTFALSLAQRIRPNVKNAREAIDVLRKEPAMDLNAMLNSLFSTGIFDPVFLFGPTFDRASVKPLLPKKLGEIIDTCIDIPIMIGYASHEGLVFSNPEKESIEKINANFDAQLKKDLYSVDDAKIAKLSPNVRKFYFGDRPITDKEYAGLVQYKSDTMITNGVQHTCDNQRRSKSPTYIYRFSFICEMTIPKMLTSFPIAGASHGDELNLLFYAEKLGELSKKKENSKEEMMKDRMLRMWTSFAKHGNPTPQVDDLLPIKWPPISSNNKHFYEINDEVAVGVDFGKKAWDFWKNLDKNIIQESYNYVYPYN